MARAVCATEIGHTSCLLEVIMSVFNKLPYYLRSHVAFRVCLLILLSSLLGACGGQNDTRNDPQPPITEPPPDPGVETPPTEPVDPPEPLVRTVTIAGVDNLDEQSQTQVTANVSDPNGVAKVTWSQTFGPEIQILDPSKMETSISSPIVLVQDSPAQIGLMATIDYDDGTQITTEKALTIIAVNQPPELNLALQYPPGVTTEIQNAVYDLDGHVVNVTFEPIDDATGLSFSISDGTAFVTAPNVDTPLQTSVTATVTDNEGQTTIQELALTVVSPFSTANITSHFTQAEFDLDAVEQLPVTLKIDTDGQVRSVMLYQVTPMSNNLIGQMLQVDSATFELAVQRAQLNLDQQNIELLAHFDMLGSQSGVSHEFTLPAVSLQSLAQAPEEMAQTLFVHEGVAYSDRRVVYQLSKAHTLEEAKTFVLTLQNANLVDVSLSKWLLLEYNEPFSSFEQLKLELDQMIAANEVIVSGFPELASTDYSYKANFEDTVFESPEASENIENNLRGAQVPMMLGEYSGKSMKVGIIEGGFTSVSDFGTNIKVVDHMSSLLEFWLNPFIDASAAFPFGGYHGTIVTSILGAQHNGQGLVGLIPDAELYVCNNRWLFGFSNCLFRLNALGVEVVNISTGYDFVLNEFSNATKAFLHDVMASYPDMVVVAATSYRPNAPDSYPSTSDFVITVGGVLGNFVEPKLDPSIYLRSYIDLWAPSQQVGLIPTADVSKSNCIVNKMDLSRDYQIGLCAGTSFAAPIVTAYVAKLCQKWKTLAEPKACTREEVLSHLLSTSDQTFLSLAGNGYYADVLNPVKAIYGSDPLIGDFDDLEYRTVLQEDGRWKVHIANQTEHDMHVYVSDTPTLTDVSNYLYLKDEIEVFVDGQLDYVYIFAAPIETDGRFTFPHRHVIELVDASIQVSIGISAGPYYVGQPVDLHDASPVKLMNSKWRVTDQNDATVTVTYEDGQYAFVPTTSGDHTIELSTRSSIDGEVYSDQIKISVEAPPNTPPFGHIEVSGEQRVSHEVCLVANYTDHDPLSYQWTITAPSGFELNSDQDALCFILQELGQHAVELVVSDGELVDSDEIVILAIPEQYTSLRHPVHQFHRSEFSEQAVEDGIVELSLLNMNFEVTDLKVMNDTTAFIKIEGPNSDMDFRYDKIQLGNDERLGDSFCVFLPEDISLFTDDPEFVFLNLLLSCEDPTLNTLDQPYQQGTLGDSFTFIAPFTKSGKCSSVEDSDEDATIFQSVAKQKGWTLGYIDFDDPESQYGSVEFNSESTHRGCEFTVKPSQPGEYNLAFAVYDTKDKTTGKIYYAILKVD